jgi:shikimate 5-dehydrogenase
MSNSQKNQKFDNLRNLNTIGVRRHADDSIDYQSQLISSSTPTKNCPYFTYPHLFLIFHHHRRKKAVDGFKMMAQQHSDSFDKFHFFNFQSDAFLQLYLYLLTALVSELIAMQIIAMSFAFRYNSNAMQNIDS